MDALTVLDSNQAHFKLLEFMEAWSLYELTESEQQRQIWQVPS